MPSKILRFSLLSLVLAAATCSVGSAGERLTALPADFQAPALDLPELNGGRVRLSDYRGQPLIVNFWALWCPPCRAEMPSLQRAWEQLEGEGIGLIAVNVGDDPDTVRPFTRAMALTFPFPMDLDSRLSEAWTVGGLPTTFVVDPRGNLAYVVTGERDWDDPALLDLVRALKR